MMRGKTAPIAPIAARGALCVAVVFAAVVGCEKPESFHLGGAPSMGIQVGPGGAAGGGDLGGGGGTVNSGRPGSGGLFGSGGIIGTGGRGSGGVSPFSGSAGNPGDSGQGGAAGSSAAGGRAAGGSSSGGGVIGNGGQAGGAAGAGGGPSAAAGGAGGSGPPSLSVQCRNNAPADNTAMNAEIWIANGSPQAAPLGQMRVRYYYVNEGGTIGLEIFDKAFKNPDGSGYRAAQVMFTGMDGKLTAPPMDYTDIALASNETLDATVAFYFKMSLHDPNHSKLDLTNDYSNGPAAISTCPHIVVYLGDTIVAGVPPAP